MVDIIDHTTITIGNLSARVLGRALRDPRLTPIAIDYYATIALAELLRQLPEPGEADAPLNE